MAQTKQLSLRIPMDLLSELRGKGRVTGYIIDAVREKIARDRAAEIDKSLQCLADDPEANDLSFFAPGQDEVMNRVD